jgi:hypothetical protein
MTAVRRLGGIVDLARFMAQRRRRSRRGPRGPSKWDDGHYIRLLELYAQAVIVLQWPRSKALEVISNSLNVGCDEVEELIRRARKKVHPDDLSALGKQVLKPPRGRW